MTESELRKNKDELLELVRDTRAEAERLTSQAREIVKQGQYVQDLAKCTEEFIVCVPRDTDLPERVWDNEKSQWRALRGGVTKAHESVTRMRVLALADSTAVTTTTVISTAVVASLPLPAQGPAQRAYERYEQFLEQSNLVRELEQEVHRLGLDHSPSGSESSLSLLRKADHAFRTPSVEGGDCIAVLIPLREAINRAFADLLSRRPNQEGAASHGNKVHSICTQVCRPPADAVHITQLAQEADGLNKVLSGSKHGAMTRTQVREVMNRGLVFFLAFLRTLDENRLRRVN